jgi:hypothetical protein
LTLDIEGLFCSIVSSLLHLLDLLVYLLFSSLSS